MFNNQYSMHNVQFRKTGFCLSYFIALASYFLFTSCSVQKQISKSATRGVLDAAPLQTAHIGICIYEPATSKYWYDYQGDKYFVPASNTKIPTCYAALKYLGDSLVGLKYVTLGKGNNKDIWIQATGDPTLLHPDFTKQPVIDFLKKDTSVLFALTTNNQWKDDAYGSGWSWNDYDAAYMAERSLFPVYGNVVRFYGNKEEISIIPNTVELSYGGEANNTSGFSFKNKKYNFSRAKDKNLFFCGKMQLAN